MQALVSGTNRLPINMFIKSILAKVLVVVITTFMGIGVSSQPSHLNEAAGIHNTIEESNGSLGRGNSQGKRESKNWFKYTYQSYLISVTSLLQAITKATSSMTRKKRRLSWRSSVTN